MSIAATSNSSIQFRWGVGQRILHEQQLHSKLYLHAGRTFQSELPHIYNKVLKLAQEVDAASWQLAMEAELTVRCAEYHTYGVGGGTALCPCLVLTTLHLYRWLDAEVPLR